VLYDVCTYALILNILLGCIWGRLELLHKPRFFVDFCSAPAGLSQFSD
jgi:hypothetical protein